MKRFYKLVSTRREGDIYLILLDGKVVKTPARNDLQAGSEALAQEILKEWAAQEEEIRPDSMPLTQLASTRIDRVAQERSVMTGMILKYFDTDLICYRTDDPPPVGEKQCATWDPWLDWFEERFGHRLETTTDLKALRHSEAAHKDIGKYIEALDDDRFTVLQMATGLSGSLVLALAFAEGKIDVDQLYEAMRVEEMYKAEVYDEQKYGPDPLQGKKEEAVIADLKAAARYLELINKVY